MHQSLQSLGSLLLEKVRNNQTADAKALLEANTPTIWCTLDNNSCLHLAVKNKNAVLIKLLIDHGAELHGENLDGLTPIQLAMLIGIEEQCWHYVKIIAEGRSTNPSDSSRYGSALLTAVRYNQPDTAIALLNAKAPTNRCSKSNNYSCLHWAVENKNEWLIQVLIDTNPNLLTSETSAGLTPIELAAAHKNWRCVKTIAEKYKTNYIDAPRYSNVLLSAVRYNQTEVVNALLHAKASPMKWCSKESGYTCLHWAVENMNVALIKLLICYGAKPNIKDNQGQTPIQLAYAQKNLDCIGAITNKPSHPAGMLSFVPPDEKNQPNAKGFFSKSGNSFWGNNALKNINDQVEKEQKDNDVFNSIENTML